MTLKLLLGLLFIVWRLTSAEEYTNHWRATEDVANVEFCSHDSYKNGSCICNVDYNGGYCLNRKCRNFGYNGQSFPNGFKVDRCICPPGFLGRNCEPVACVPGKDQVYSSMNNEKSVSILVSYNSKMQETWKTDDIGQLICNKTQYWRSFNYNYDNAAYNAKYTESSVDCYKSLGTYLTADPCMDEDKNPEDCQLLDIANLDSLVQNSPPNSIVFVVTNMGLTSMPSSVAENIKATAIARRIQINVLVYNNTGFMASDPGLAYLSDIATATLGTYILPSVKPLNEQYDIVNALLENWDQGNQISAVFTSEVKNLPVDNSLDLYVAAQTYYAEDLTFNVNPMPTVVKSTDFWKLYKLSAGSFGAILQISNQVDSTPVLVYSSGGLRAYSAFTSDSVDNIMVVDAAYSVSVAGAAYSLVVRLESGNSALDYDSGLRTIGTPASITLDKNFYGRSICQFNFVIGATCNSAGGASVVTLITGDNRRSVSFPVYCASFGYASNIYNNLYSETVEITHLQQRQSLSRDFACSSDMPHEKYGGRSLVIIAENSTDTNSNKSSVGNVFRNKNSIFYQLTDFVKSDNYNTNPRYGSFLAVLNNGGSTPRYQQSENYDIFLTKVMSATSGSPNHDSSADAVSIKELVVDAIRTANAYSDVLIVINYNVTIFDDDVTDIQSALQIQRSRLFILFVQTYMNYTNDIYYQANRLAISSGGVTVRLNSYDDLHNFFVQYFPLLIANDIVAKAYSENQKAGIALNNVYLLNEAYYLLVTNEDLAGDGIVPASVSISGVDVTNVATIGELQLFTFTPPTAGVYNIPILFSTSGLAQYSNAILLVNTNTTNYISLSFVDIDGKNRNDVVYNEGAFIPVIYSSSPFGDNSNISITYSDAANPAKQVYSGSIVSNTGCGGFKNYNWTTAYSWTCSNSGGLYHFKIDRVGDNGVISRTFPITCLGADAGDCLHGGTETDVGCVCPLEYTGSKCEAPICLNGGTLTPADTCECLVAFSGNFCESYIGNCTNTPSSPDYRADLSSLVIIADVNALAVGGMTSDFGVTGVPITVVLYGDGNDPRIVKTTTSSQNVQDVLATIILTTPSTTASSAPANSDMYKALNLALDNQITNRALYVVYTSNADVPVDSDFLIRLAAKRAEIRVLSVSGTESDNARTLALVGNSIPFGILASADFQSYLSTYVGPVFQSLQYQGATPQRVFNVFKTDKLTETTTISIPKDTIFDTATAVIFLQVYNGYLDVPTPPTPIGTTRILSIPYNPKDGYSLPLKLAKDGVSAYYAVEIVGYLKTAYLFNKDNANGSNELLNSGVVYNESNTMHIRTAPFYEVASANPANFPFMSIREIMSNGSVSDASTVLFSRKNGDTCLFEHFTVFNVCSLNTTIGYQVQLTTRASATEDRQQQFVLTCFKTTYQNGNTVCKGHGSPKDICSCDDNWRGIDCTEPLCMNGGVRDMSVCRCPVDTFGILCDQRFDLTPTTVSTSTVTYGTSTPSPTSTATSTLGTTQSTSPPTTTTPKQVRAVAFILDLVGADAYAYNQTIQSLTQYFKAFGNNHWVMLIGNLNGNSNESFEFTQYSDETHLLNKTYNFWPLRSLASRTSNVSSALTSIRDAFNNKGAEFRNAVSLNIFYLTQDGLEVKDDPSTNMGGLEVFTKSAIVYSPFTQSADQTVVDSLSKFSDDVTTAREYYSGLKSMVHSTAQNSSANLPDKPATFSCVYGLQSNIRVAIDRSNFTSIAVNTTLDTFLRKFRLGFNYIENDEDRCSAPDLPSFYNEKTAFTAFPYYDSTAKTAKFCPSQYTSMLSYPVTGKQFVPNYSDKYVAALGKNINGADCSCNRFSDEKTIKFILWLPRAPIPSSDTYMASLKLNTTNAFHFVVPFYDITEDSKATDLYYQILTTQVKGGDYYLLPNAATVDDIQTDIIDKLYEKFCESAGVDPTAVPPSLFESNIENRHYDYYY